jgi:hypothetical protein
MIEMRSYDVNLSFDEMRRVWGCLQRSQVGTDMSKAEQLEVLRLMDKFWIWDKEETEKTNLLVKVGEVYFTSVSGYPVAIVELPANLYEVDGCTMTPALKSLAFDRRSLIGDYEGDDEGDGRAIAEKGFAELEREGMDFKSLVALYDEYRELYNTELNDHISISLGDIKARNLRLAEIEELIGEPVCQEWVSDIEEEEPR